MVRFLIEELTSEYMSCGTMFYAVQSGIIGGGEMSDLIAESKIEYEPGHYKDYDWYSQDFIHKTLFQQLIYSDVRLSINKSHHSLVAAIPCSFSRLLFRSKELHQFHYMVSIFVILQFHGSYLFFFPALPFRTP